MPELRGIQATEEVKEEWKYAYSLYLQAPGDRYDYEAWQRNIKKGLVT